MPLLAAIKDWFDWFPGRETVDVLKWILVVGLIVVGFVGTFLPILPGTTLIYAGFVAHYFLFGLQDSGLGWPSLIVTGILWIVSIVVDWLSGAMGAKWFGSSKWGVWGALLGGIVGAILFSLPGLILGPVLGVFIAEMAFAKKEWKPAANSTVGTLVGGLAGAIAKTLIAMAMIFWYLADVFLLNPSKEDRDPPESPPAPPAAVEAVKSGEGSTEAVESGDPN